MIASIRLPRASVVAEKPPRYVYWDPHQINDTVWDNDPPDAPAVEFVHANGEQARPSVPLRRTSRSLAPRAARCLRAARAWRDVCVMFAHFGQTFA